MHVGAVYLRCANLSGISPDKMRAQTRATSAAL